MGFGRGGVWIMGYRGLMGYGLKIPAHRLGGPKNLWDIRGYGLSQAWVMRGSTVILSTHQNHQNTLRAAICRKNIDEPLDCILSERWLRISLSFHKGSQKESIAYMFLITPCFDEEKCPLCSGIIQPHALDPTRILERPKSIL
ncbi:hypothetical protein BDZ97DRAFT_1712975 [Flammula alnicola]|nr:hypothetical protein BDZ97DRAFT_1712975 [Flammula alnicola]